MDIALIALVVMAALVLLWNILLRRRIAAATMALEQRNRLLASTNEALGTSETKFRTIFNNAPIGIFRTTFDGRIIEANETMAKMLGYANRDDLLSSIRDLAQDIYPNSQERQRVLDALIQSPKGVRRAVEFKHKDGSAIYANVNAVLSVDETGNPTFLDGTIENVTPLKQTENELRRLASAVEQSGEIIVVTDTNGRIEYVNRAFERITGYGRKEALGRRLNLIKSGKHDLDFYENLWRTIANGQTWTGRLTNRRKDGSFFTEEATISPVFDAHGKIINYVAAKRDISDELVREEQYRQMQKIEAIGQLTGGVAHDFNNLLQAINGYTDLAVMEMAADSQRANSYLDQARNAGQRASDLVQQLLLFSRRKIMEPKIFNLNALVADFLKMVGRILGEHIRIEWHPQQAPSVIRGDSGMLEQVLMNLCVNARDAMPEGGVLRIETQNVFLGEAFCLGHAWASPGDFAVLQVADTGRGMDPETQKKIFEPFFTTKGEGKGTGLGMATSYGIVKQHQGMIDVESRPGKGTVFRVYLPLCHQEQGAENDAPPEESAGGSETILLAEDDEVVRELAITILEKGGYQVLAAKDGQEALDLLTQDLDRVDLLLLDMVMPHMSGWAVFEKAREQRSDIAVLFASGYNEETIRSDFVRLEEIPLIQKPYTPALLLRKVRDTLDAFWDGN